MAIDLHIHTTNSDGDYTPKEVVEFALEKNLQAIAITDHDSVSGVEEGLFFGKKHGIEVIPGCEFYAEHMGKWLHMLGYFIDHKCEVIAEFVSRIEDERKKTVVAQIEKLRETGFYLDEEKVFEENAKPMYTTFSNVIFKDKRNSKNELISKYLKTKNHIVRFCMDWMIPGKPFNAPGYTPEASYIISLIEKAGGVPILAHPAATLKEADDYVIDDLLKCGMKGLEIYTSWHNEENEKHYECYSSGKDIIVTCGSDFHGKLKPHARIGEVKNNTYDVVEKLKEAKYQYQP